MTTRLTRVRLVPLYCLALSWIAARICSADPCNLQRYASLDTVMDDEYVLIPATSKGHEAWMMLNTQSPFAALWAPYARDYADTVKPLGSDPPVYSDGQVVTHIAEASGFRLGLAVIHHSQFLVTKPLPYLDHAVQGKPIIGFLGMGFFSNVDVELDIAHSKFNLYSPDHCFGGGVVYWADRHSAVSLIKGPLGTYYFPMDLDGKKVEASLETNRIDSALTTDVSRKLFGFDETSAGIEHRSTGTGQAISHYRAMTISTDDLKIVNADVQLEHAQSYCDLGRSRDKTHAALHSGCIGSEAPLKLGMGVISKMHLYFATKESMLYFTAAEATHEGASATSAHAAPSGETSTPAPGSQSVPHFP
jgi:hypothetical protein